MSPLQPPNDPNALVLYQISQLRNDINQNFVRKETYQALSDDVKDLQDMDKTKLNRAFTVICIVTTIVNSFAVLKGLHLF